MTWRPEATIDDFRTVARLAGVELSSGAISIESLSAPHVPPTRLPFGKMAVYVFSKGAGVLKVGKVGTKSQARYTSQHYNPGSAMTTLAASILADRTWFGSNSVDEATIGRWIRENIDRVNLLMDAARRSLSRTAGDIPPVSSEASIRGFQGSMVIKRGANGRCQRRSAASATENLGSPRHTEQMTQYWAYENCTVKRATLHRAECNHCDHGRGKQPADSGLNGRWLDPFADRSMALQALERTGAQDRRACAFCAPQHDTSNQRS